MRAAPEATFPMRPKNGLLSPVGGALISVYYDVLACAVSGVCARKC